MDNRKSLICPFHKGQTASKFKVIIQNITRRFSSYQDASRFLTGLRFKIDEGSYDPRDYRTSRPLGFQNLTLKWLKVKKRETSPNTYRKLKGYMERFSQTWANENVKYVQYGEIEEFMLDMPGSDKTRHNYLAGLKQFFVWAEKAHRIKSPDFPTITFTLKRRKIITKEQQSQILDRVYDLCKPLNAKIWIGCKWLARYVNCRPNEILNIKEGDINLETRTILISDTKEGEPKILYLLDDDVELIKSFPRVLNRTLPFFRHRAGVKGITAGSRFGVHLFYTFWKRAASELDIDCDLYGGTRHSTVSALRGSYSPETIRAATMHTTNKAFDRYFQVDGEYLRGIYADKGLTRKNQGGSRR